MASAHNRPTGLMLDHFKYANGDVDVYRQLNGSWVLWVLVRDSVAVPGGGKGLFAGRNFSAQRFIGRYVGRVLSRNEEDVERLCRTVGGDAVVNINGIFVDGRRPVQSETEQMRRVQRVVFRQPEWSWPGIYAHIANDAYGTNQGNNAKVTPGGYMHATRHIPAYNFALPHAQNAASEILWSYGREYWRDSDILGTAALPFFVD